MNLSREDEALRKELQDQVKPPFNERAVELLTGLRKKYRIRCGQFFSKVALDTRFNNVPVDTRDWHKERYISAYRSLLAIEQIIATVEVAWKEPEKKVEVADMSELPGVKGR